MTANGALQGKISLVLGASKGIGAGTARAFGRAGATVVLASRDEQALNRVADEIRSAGARALVVPTDMGDEGQVASLVTFDEAIRVSLRGTLIAMKYEIPPMVTQGAGAIVNMSSTAGLQGVRGMGAYAAAKHGVIGATKSAALDYAAKGIRINAVLPAAIETDMYRRFVGENAESKAAMTAMHPIGRIGKSEEIADAAIWLSSSKSSFVTGHSLLVDGGFTAQ